MGNNQRFDWSELMPRASECCEEDEERGNIRLPWQQPAVPKESKEVLSAELSFNNYSKCFSPFGFIMFPLSFGLVLMFICTNDLFSSSCPPWDSRTNIYRKIHRVLEQPVCKHRTRFQIRYHCYLKCSCMSTRLPLSYLHLKFQLHLQL